jgi:predicted RNase H-like HicB family nuclease
MPTQSMIDAYLRALLQHVKIEPLDEGGYQATVPEAFGVVASGDDPRECANDLRRRLERWIRTRMARGVPLPVVDGIDPNGEFERLVADYHDAAFVNGDHGEVFLSDADFRAALARWAKGG